MSEKDFFSCIPLASCVDLQLENHKDEYIGIILCVAGNCECEIENEFFYCTASTAMFVQLVEQNKINIRTSAHCQGVVLRILLDDDFYKISRLFGLTCFLSSMKEKEKQVFVIDSRHRILAKKIMESDSSISRDFVKIKVVELLLLFASQSSRITQLRENIPQIGSFICENISERYTITQLSTIFAMTPYCLKKEFVQYYGSTVYVYIKAKKIYYAAKLLVASELKIIDIAMEVGYTNASKFSDAFYRVLHMTPKKFRMEQKNKKNT